MKVPYDDIIEMPHHVSSTRPKMTMANRAAQFSPFAALTGYEAAVKETSRLTDRKIELDENAMAVLDMKLHMLTDKINTDIQIGITYFRTDKKKTGGSYVTTFDGVKRIDSFSRIVHLTNGEKIKIDDILDIDMELQ